MKGRLAGALAARPEEPGAHDDAPTKLALGWLDAAVGWIGSTLVAQTDLRRSARFSPAQAGYNSDSARSHAAAGGGR